MKHWDASSHDHAAQHFPMNHNETAGHTAGVLAWHVGLSRKDWKEKPHLKDKPHLRAICRRGKGWEFNGQPPSFSHFLLVQFHSLGS